MIEEKRDFYIDGSWVQPSKINDLEVKSISGWK